MNTVLSCRMADTTKQAVGMLGVHGMNLLLSQLLPIKNPDPCIMLVGTALVCYHSVLPQIPAQLLIGLNTRPSHHISIAQDSGNYCQQI